MPACVWPTSDAVPSMNTPVQAVRPKKITRIQYNGVFSICTVV